MYKVLCDKKLLHDDTRRALRIDGGTLTLELGKSGLFEFTIYQDHPYYAIVKPLKSLIQVYRNGVEIFSGRALSIKYGMHNEKQVACEGDLAYLLDSMIPPHTYSSSFAGYMAYVLQMHNKQVEGYKQMQVGNITVADFMPFPVVENLNYYSAYDTLSKRMVERSGGFLQVRTVEGVHYLDLLSTDIDQGNVSNQPIRLGRNLLEVKEEINGGEVFTAIVPLGAKREGTEIRLDVKGVNDGKDYIVNEEAAAAYGLIYRTVIFDTITDESTLKQEAEKYLADNFAASSSIEITAADLSSIDESLDSYNVGQWVKVYSPTHGYHNQLFLIKKIVIKIADPSATKIEIGRTGKSLTDRISSIASDASTAKEAASVQPYVLESGTTGIFRWKKFSDGTCEFFGKVPVVDYACSASLGTWYKGDTIFDADAYPYPFQMAEAPAVTMTFQTRNAIGAIVWPFSDSIDHAQGYLPQCYLIRPTTAEGITGNINVVGKGRL